MLASGQRTSCLTSLVTTNILRSVLDGGTAFAAVIGPETLDGDDSHIRNPKERLEDLCFSTFNAHPSSGQMSECRFDPLALRTDNNWESLSQNES